tara:strand:- start:6428 stop:7108 length:681 start_codon:yes stop_codon:yes gene_type:complete
MKTTLDTNIFLYAVISKKCAIKVSDTYKNNKYNIILRSVNEETKPKLYSLFTIFTVLRYETVKTRNAIKLIDSNFYDKFNNDFPQIYKAIRNYIIISKINDKNKIEEFIEVLDNILNDIRYLVQIVSKNLYPVTKKDYSTVKGSKMFKDCINSLKNIIKNNDLDKIHMGLCNQFLSENLRYKDKMFFFTMDKDDFIKHGNKEKIEKIIKNLVINTLPILDVENIIL